MSATRCGRGSLRCTHAGSVDAADALAQRRGDARPLAGAHDRLEIQLAAAEVVERSSRSGHRIVDDLADEEARQLRLVAQGAWRDLKEDHAVLVQRVTAVAGVEGEMMPRLAVDARREPGAEIVEDRTGCERLTIEHRGDHVDRKSVV